MKTAVLFICHIVNNESMSRFNMLKTACDKLGFDIYWAIDCAISRTSALPSGVDFYSFSCKRYEAEMPFAIYRQSRLQYLNATAAATLLFWKDHAGQYEKIWITEYDVCLAGRWDKFFKKYSDESIDYAVNRFTMPGPDLGIWNKWYHYSHANKDLMDKFRIKGALVKTEQCLCMLSDQLLTAIYDFLKINGDGSVFYEWVWPTIAAEQRCNIAQFQSNNFTVNRISDKFADFQPEMPYHAVKLDVSWNILMDRRGIQLWSD